MFRRIFNFMFGERLPKAEPETAISTDPAAGVFSTDLVDRCTLAVRMARALEKAIPVKPKDFVTVDANGNAVAMDGASGDYTLKDAFKLSSGGIPDAQLLWFSGQGFIGHQLCAVLSQNWLIRKACTMPAKDALRNGYEITVNDGTQLDAVTKDAIRAYDESMGLTKAMLDYIGAGRVFGIRVALFLVKSADPKYYEQPFNPDGVTAGSYKGISLIDPYWCAPELDTGAASNPASRGFYEPTWWRINGQRVHKSHLCIFKTEEVPDVLKPSYLYGGIPIPQKIYERVYAAERTANEAPQLALTKRTNAIHVDLDRVVTDQYGFEEKMAQWAYYRDNYGVKVLGTEETMEQFDTSLTDLDAAIMTQYQLVAAAAGVPATKLLGTSPKGFNASGEYEAKSYHEELESIQANDLTPLLKRHYLLADRSHYIPKLGCSIAVVPVWKPVDSIGAEAQANINKTKAETDKVLFDAGAIDGEDVRNRIITDPDSGYSGIDAAQPEPLPEETPDGSA